MARTTLPSGIEIEYDTFGDPTDPALLLVMGYTAQMISWADELMQAFADQGLFVIRFDNRDCGLSSKLDGQAANPMAVLTAILGGEAVPPVPYTLSDMAADGIGLLDHLGIERAHIAGASMGGMIVQTMAIEHPTRVASLTSIMSTIGNPLVGAPTHEAREALLAPPPTEREAYIEASVRAQRLALEEVLRRRRGQGRWPPWPSTGRSTRKVRPVSWRRSTRAAIARRASPHSTFRRS